MITITGPIQLIRGDDYVFRITVTDDTDARVDLTSAAIQFQIRTAPGAAGAPAVAKSVGSGITVLDQTQPTTKGQADIAIDSADTAAAGVPAGVYWLDAVTVILSKRHHVIDPMECEIIDSVTPPV